MAKMGRCWLQFFSFVLVFIGFDDIIKILGLYPGLGQYCIIMSMSVLLHAYKVHFVNACIKLMLIIL